MDDFTKVTVLDNEIEALHLEAILNEEGIPHVLISYHDTAYDGLYQSQKGWGHVSAPEEVHESILEIVSDLRQP